MFQPPQYMYISKYTCILYIQCYMCYIRTIPQMAVDIMQLQLHLDPKLPVHPPGSSHFLPNGSKWSLCQQLTLKTFGRNDPLSIFPNTDGINVIVKECTRRNRKKIPFFNYLKQIFGENFIWRRVFVCQCSWLLSALQACSKKLLEKITKKIIKKIHKQIHALNSFGTSCQFWGSMMVVSIDLRADANRFVKFRFLEKRKC